MSNRQRVSIVLLAVSMLLGAASSAFPMEPERPEGGGDPILTAVEYAAGERAEHVAGAAKSQPNIALPQSGRVAHAQLVDRPQLVSGDTQVAVLVVWPNESGSLIGTTKAHASVVVVADDAVVNSLDLGLAEPTSHSLTTAGTMDPDSSRLGAADQFGTEPVMAGAGWVVLCELFAFNPYYSLNYMWAETLEVCEVPVYIDLTSNLERGSSNPFGWDYDATFAPFLQGYPEGYCGATTTNYGYRTRASVVVALGTAVASAVDLSDTKYYPCRR